MKLEINERFAPDDGPLQFGDIEVFITPPLDEDYWLARVQLGSNAIVCFPKFTTIGIGFQHEVDWNTNLPYTSDAAVIWRHIKHNKADPTITRADGIAAIKAIQAYAISLRAQQS